MCTHPPQKVCSLGASKCPHSAFVFQLLPLIMPQYPKQKTIPSTALQNKSNMKIQKCKRAFN